MWEDWKKAWQDAVANFERELSAPDTDFATPSHRAQAMRRDLSAAQDALNRLEGDIAQAQKDVAAEEESEQTARRRASMAERINDAETVRIAIQFAERHTQRAGILRRKAEVLQEELAMRQEELAAMEEQAGVGLDELEELDASPKTGDLLQREKDDYNFRKMDRERKEKAADAMLEELKKKMNS